jgi:uncharacterized protein YjiS (DUF1127 family)
MHEIARDERPSGRSAASARQASLFESPAAALLRHIRTWRQRIRQRRSLATADDWLLKDIGVSRADVMHECDKAFWRE